jgi:hypothetical protein
MKPARRNGDVVANGRPSGIAGKFARPERFELPTPWFVDRTSFAAKHLIFLLLVAREF